jgi:hypothetical protein
LKGLWSRQAASHLSGHILPPAVCFIPFFSVGQIVFCFEFSQMALAEIFSKKSVWVSLSSSKHFNMSLWSAYHKLRVGSNYFFDFSPERMVQEYVVNSPGMEAGQHI